MSVGSSYDDDDDDDDANNSGNSSQESLAFLFRTLCHDDEPTSLSILVHASLGGLYAAQPSHDRWAKIESSPVLDISCLAELIYDLINKQLLCKECPKPVTIQCLRSVAVHCLMSSSARPTDLPPVRPIQQTPVQHPSSFLVKGSLPPSDGYT